MLGADRDRGHGGMVSDEWEEIRASWIVFFSNGK